MTSSGSEEQDDLDHERNKTELLPSNVQRENGKYNVLVLIVFDSYNRCCDTIYSI